MKNFSTYVAQSIFSFLVVIASCRDFASSSQLTVAPTNRAGGPGVGGRADENQGGSTSAAGQSDAVGSAILGQGGEDTAGGSHADGGQSENVPVTPVPSTGIAGEDAGEAPNRTEEVLIPGCIMHIGNEPMTFTTPTALSASLVQNSQQYALYATQPSTNVFSLRWSLTTEFTAQWQPWTCFDFVPHPQRTSAANLHDTTPEVYATSADGGLFVRRLYFQPVGWGPWEQLGLPTEASQANDVAAVGLPSDILFLYLVDRGNVFVRRRETSEPSSAYLPWTQIATPVVAEHVCGAIRIDGRQQVFITALDGSVSTAVQDDTDLDSAFGPFQAIGADSARPFADLKCGYNADQSLAVFGLNAGVVWMSSESTDVWTSWSLESDSLAPRLITLAAGSQADQPTTLFGTDSVNQLWHHLVGSTGWEQIP